ncbi:hypothetical protein [Paenibacillus rigui]|nr:hypothetical protein [Paenibacillus rigui]
MDIANKACRAAGLICFPAAAGSQILFMRQLFIMASRKEPETALG